MSNQSEQIPAPDDPSGRTLVRRKIAIGGVWAFLGRIGSVLLVVAVNGLASRLLSRDEMGAYFICMSFVAILSILTQMGLNHSIVKLLASEMALDHAAKAKAHILAAFKLVLLLSLGIVFLFSSTLTKDFIYRFFSSNLLKNELGWVSLWAALYSFQTLLAEIWRGLQKIDHATVFGGLSTQFFTLAFLGILIFLDHSTHLHGVVLISICSIFISILLSLLLMLPLLAEFGKVRLTSTRDLIGFSWPFLFTSITLFMLSQADLWLVGFLSPEAEVAYYGAAVRITLLTTMPLAIVNSVIPPFLAERHTIGDKQGMETILRSSALIAFLPALLLFVIYWFFGSQLLELIFGGGYGQGSPIMLILTGGYLVHILAGSPGFTLMMTGNQKPMMIITIIAATSMLLVGYLAGKAIGPSGVAWGSFFGLTLQTIGMWTFTKLRLGIWTHPKFSRIFLLREIVQGLLMSRSR